MGRKQDRATGENNVLAISMQMNEPLSPALSPFHGEREKLRSRRGRFLNGERLPTRGRTLPLLLLAFTLLLLLSPACQSKRSAPQSAAVEKDDAGARAA